MADSEQWRATDLGHRVFTIFNEEELLRLEQSVKRVGYRDKDVEALFPELIRQWAFRWLNRISGSKRRNRPSGSSRRDGDRDECISKKEWKKIVEKAVVFSSLIESLPPSTRRYLI